MSMNYRIAGPNDISALRILGLASYGTLKNHLIADNWKKMESVLLSEETFPVLVNSCFAFVCEEDSKLLGMHFLFRVEIPLKYIQPIPVISAWWAFIRTPGERE